MARRLRRREQAPDEPRWIELASRQLAAGNVAYALELWRPPLDPAHGKILTNGDFAHAPSGQGFDWRPGPADCTTSHWRAGSLTLNLSGDEPETCPLLEHTLPRAPHARAYRLKVCYLTDIDAGLHWEFDGTDLGLPPSGAETTVKTARASPLSTLRLIYRRDPGDVPTQGQLELRSVSLEVERDL